MQIERWSGWLGVGGAVRSFWQAHGLCGDWLVEGRDEDPVRAPEIIEREADAVAVATDRERLA